MTTIKKRVRFRTPSVDTCRKSAPRNSLLHESPELFPGVGADASLATQLSHLLDLDARDLRDKRVWNLAEVRQDLHLPLGQFDIAVLDADPGEGGLHRTEVHDGRTVHGRVQVRDLVRRQHFEPMEPRRRLHGAVEGHVDGASVPELCDQVRTEPRLANRTLGCEIRRIIPESREHFLRREFVPALRTRVLIERVLFAAQRFDHHHLRSHGHLKALFGGHCVTHLHSMRLPRLHPVAETHAHPHLYLLWVASCNPGVILKSAHPPLFLSQN